MKENLGTKLKRKWNDLTEGQKGMAIGSAIGTLATAIISGFVTKHRDNKWIDAANMYADDESKKAYLHGIQDGQIKAYRTLLTQPEKAFKQMGFKDKDIVKF